MQVLLPMRGKNQLTAVNWTIIAGENQSSYAPPLQTSTYFRRIAINRQGVIAVHKSL